MYTYIHLHICICISICTHTYIYIYMRTLHTKHIHDGTCYLNREEVVQEEEEVAARRRKHEGCTSAGRCKYTHVYVTVTLI